MLFSHNIFHSLLCIYLWSALRSTIRRELPRSSKFYKFSQYPLRVCVTKNILKCYAWSIYNHAFIWFQYIILFNMLFFRNIKCNIYKVTEIFFSCVIKSFIPVSVRQTAIFIYLQRFKIVIFKQQTLAMSRNDLYFSAYALYCF